MSTKQLEAVVKRLEDAATRFEAIYSQKPALPPKPTNTSSSSITAASGQVPPAVKQYDEQVEEPLRAFLTTCKSIGNEVGIMGEKVKVVFELLKNHIWFAAGQKEPPQDVVQKKLESMVKIMQEIAELKEAQRNKPLFNHLSAMAEGIQAIGWINVTKTPAPFVQDMHDASKFFADRVRVEHKSDKTHTAWADGWKELLDSLKEYVRKNHTTGLVWNSNPGASPPTDSAVSGGGAFSPDTSGAKRGGPPPPPPPPPADFFKDAKPSSNAADDADASAKAALLADLNKGLEVTSRLKKVTADMQTHKNPSLRTQSTVPAGVGASGTQAAAGGAAAKPAVVKPPKTELQDGKTWIVEYHKGNRGIVVQADMKQTAYIFRCENSVVQIKGKVNSVTLDGCKKTSVVVDALLSQIEVINCQSVEVQTLGAMPTISIQKTDGCQVYLSKDSVNAEIVTSKSSEMNILVPKGDDFIELAVPEQFKTTVNLEKKKLETTVSDIV